MMVLASNVTGPSKPNGSKITAIRERILLLVCLSNGEKVAMLLNLKESEVESHTIPKDLLSQFLSFARMNSLLNAP